MAKRLPPIEARLSAMARYQVLGALGFGPWRLTGPNDEPVGERRYSDDVLGQHWHGWAKHGKSPGGWRDWGPGDWAVRRFEFGEDAVTAFMTCRQMQFADEDDEIELTNDDDDG